MSMAPNIAATSSPSMTDLDRREAFLAESLQRNERWIALADAKAAGVMVLIPALAALFGESIVTYAKLRLDELVRPDDGSAVVASILYGLPLLGAVVTAFVAFSYAYTTLLPRVGKTGDDDSGMVFFRHVAKKPVDAWRCEIASLTQEQIVTEYALQVHATSKVCEEKFHDVRHAMQWGWIHLMLAVIAYIPTAF